MILLKGLARLVSFVLLLALAVTGLAVALFSIRGGDRPLSLPALADNVALPRFRDTVGNFLANLEAPGDLALVAFLCGIGAVLVGLLLLAGALGARREPLLVLDKSGDGVLAARRRALGHVAAALVEQTRGVTTTKVKVKPRRRRAGGRLEVTALHSRNRGDAEVREAATESLRHVTDPFELKAKVRAHTGESGGSRVE